MADGSLNALDPCVGAREVNQSMAHCGYPPLQTGQGKVATATHRLGLKLRPRLGLGFGFGFRFDE
jgi:hypothetical protein